MSFKPAFEYLKSPSPDQTTLTQYLPKRSTGRINPDSEPTANPNVLIPPPAKLPPPSNNSKSMNHKKQPNYHNKNNRIHIGAYVYSRVGDLHKVHPNQKRRVREKKFGIITDSVSPKEWIIKFDDNTTRTLKSSQIRVFESSKTPGHVHEPPHEDQSQVDQLPSSFSLSSPLKKKSTVRMLDKDFDNENKDANSTMTSSTTTATATATTSITSTSTTTAAATTIGSSACSATATSIMYNSNTNDDDDDDSYVVDDEQEDELFVRNELEGNEDELSISDEDDDVVLTDIFFQHQDPQDTHQSRLIRSNRKI
jgi:hypothetical protein